MMNQDPYESFKKGIKNDLTITGIGIIGVGGIMLLGILMLSGLVTVIKDDHMDSSLRVLIGGGIIVLAIIMIASRKALNAIIKIWLFLLIGIPFLFFLFLLGYVL